MFVTPRWVLGLVYNAEGLAGVPCDEEPDCE